jgi:hypothetical protein
MDNKDFIRLENSTIGSTGCKRLGRILEKKVSKQCSFVVCR